MNDNTEGKGRVEEHRQESGTTEEQHRVPTPKPLTLEEQLATWGKRVPSRGPMIILNPHPNLIAQIRKLQEKKNDTPEED